MEKCFPWLLGRGRIKGNERKTTTSVRIHNFFVIFKYYTRGNAAVFFFIDEFCISAIVFLYCLITRQRENEVRGDRMIINSDEKYLSWRARLADPVLI